MPRSRENVSRLKHSAAKGIVRRMSGRRGDDTEEQEDIIGREFLKKRSSTNTFTSHDIDGDWRLIRSDPRRTARAMGEEENKHSMF